MHLDDTTMTYLQALAKLELTDAEQAQVRHDLERILHYADMISAIDTDAVEETTHGPGLSNVLREDEVAPSLPRDELLAGAPYKHEGAYQVPRTVD